MKKVLRNKYKAIGAIAAIILIASLVVMLSPFPAGNKTASVYAYAPNWYEDSQLSNGLWYQDINNPIYVGEYQVSFMKIYSGFAGSPTLRVMELSTYPRAYVDKDPHVYTVDTPFMVIQNDLNASYNSETEEYPRTGITDGTFIYRDSRGHVWLIGETAIHYAGESLPGDFPMWIESESLPTPSWVDNKNTVLPMVFQAIKGQLVQVVMHEGYYRQSDIATWTKVPQALFDTYVAAFTGTDTNVKINKITKNKDRTIIRILYDRIFIP